MSQTKKTVFSGLMVALGLLIPFVTAHAFGLQGTVILPMHIPVLLCGLICGGSYGALCGLIVPIISSLLTGMPPSFPMLPIMVGELFVYGLVSGLCRRTFKLPVIPSLIIAMIFGRLAASAVVWGMLNFGTRPLPFEPIPYFTSAVATGLPGIILQILFIPTIIFALRKYTNLETTKCPAAKMAKNMLLNETATCILVKNDKVILSLSGNGISPLIEIKNLHSDLAKDAYVFDKIIGKAAAMVIVLLGCKKVYAETMSDSAADFLTAHGIKFDFNSKIGTIRNRAGTGICPLENAVLNISDPELGYQKLLETIASFKQSAIAVVG
jgi:riboflavin transporter FmnP